MEMFITGILDCISATLTGMDPKATSRKDAQYVIPKETLDDNFQPCHWNYRFDPDDGDVERKHCAGSPKSIYQFNICMM